MCDYWSIMSCNGMTSATKGSTRVPKNALMTVSVFMFVYRQERIGWIYEEGVNIYVNIFIYDMLLMKESREEKEWKSGYQYIEGRMKLSFGREMQASK